MMVAIKFFCSFVVVLTTLLPDSGWGSYGIAFAYCAILFTGTGAGLQAIFKGNIFILVFTAFFTGIAMLSGLIEGRHEIYTPLATAADILLVFNIMFALKRWLGKNGIIALIKSAPSPRLQVYGVLVVQTLATLYRSVPEIINQVRSRIELSLVNRWIIARYYLQNIIMKELYVLHHLQASLYIRVTDDMVFWSERENFSLMDGAAVAAAGGALIYILVFQLRIML